MEINMKEAFVEGAIYKVQGALSDHPMPLQLKYKNDLNRNLDTMTATQ